MTVAGEDEEGESGKQTAGNSSVTEEGNKTETFVRGEVSVSAAITIPTTGGMCVQAGRQ